MKSAARCLAVLIGLVAFVSSARSAVIIEISPDGANTRVDVSGSLNTSGLSFGSPLAFASLNLKEMELWFTGSPDNYRFASHFLPVPVWHSMDANEFSYTFISGGDFGVNAFSIAVPANYVSGTPLTSSFVINGLDMETFNPQSGVILTLNNGDTVSVVAVPEPAVVALLLGVSSLGFTLVRRPRRAV
jgi:hypothetical protein